jgi:hypothetical protein
MAPDPGGQKKEIGWVFEKQLACLLQAGLTGIL